MTGSCARLVVAAVTLLAANFCLASSAGAESNDPVHVTGFLRSRSSESIRPASDYDWSFNIMMLATEGDRVTAGQTVARLEGENTKKNLQETKSSQQEDRVKNEAKVSDLKAELEELKKTLATDVRARELAAAGVAPDSASGANGSSAGANNALDWIQSARDRLIEKLDLESRDLKLQIAGAKIARKVALLATTLATNAKTELVNQSRVTAYEKSLKDSDRKASTAGVIVYKRSSWERRKPRVGATVYRGAEVLAVVNDKDLFVEAFLKEENWHAVKPGARAAVKILGRREVQVGATVERISRVVLQAGDWDRSLPSSHPLYKTRVFKVDLKLDDVPDEARPDGDIDAEIETTRAGA